jgi:hypothetical protein
MPLMLTRDSILSRIHNRPSFLSHRTSSAIGQLTQGESTISRAGEVSLSSFGFGVMQGKAKRIGGLTAFGVPLDAVVGVGLHAVGGTGLAGSASAHLHNVGDGALASAFATAGYRVGESWKETGSVRAGLRTILGTKAP